MNTFMLPDDGMLSINEDKLRRAFNTCVEARGFVRKKRSMSLFKIKSVLKSFSGIFGALGVRDRYVFTRKNTLRLRYVFPSVCVFFAAVAFAIPSVGTFLQKSDSVQSVMVVAEGFARNHVDLAADTGSFPSAFSGTDMAQFIKAEPAAGGPEYPKHMTLEIGRGDTVAGLLQKNGVSGSDSFKAVKLLSDHYDVRKIRPGQSFEIVLDVDADAQADEQPYLQHLVFALDQTQNVTVDRQDGDIFTAERIEKEVFTQVAAGEARIQTSLYGSAAKAGIPTPVVARMIKMYSWAVDFQRDIRSNDRIEVMYEVNKTADGTVVGYGDIQYANLNLGGIDIPLYRFEHKNGDVEYYDEDGHSTKTTLMRTPVDGARISSGFGMRRHPVLGYNKMHKGMDFAAATGTPIYAAGDGTIDRIGRNGGYGNYIRVRHNGTLQTAYAHMHRYAKGMQKGKRVKQGQVIGYVGSTGRSTGPHLHYEVIVNGKQVNPKRVDLPVGENLKGEELRKFKKQRVEFQQSYVTLIKSLELAAQDDKSKSHRSKTSG